MPEIILDLPLDKAVEIFVPKNLQPRWLAVPPFQFKVTYKVDNPLRLEVLRTIGSEVYKDWVESKVLPILQDLDKQYGGCKEFNKLGGLRDQMLQRVQALQQEAERAAKEAVDKYCQKKGDSSKAWQAHQVGIAVKLGTGAAGVALSTVSVATGGLTVLGLVGLFRAAMGVAQTLWDCYQSAEDLEKKVRDALTSLQKSSTQEFFSAKEVARTVANCALTWNASQTVKTLKESNELWGQKLNHLEILAEYLANQLEKFLGESEKLRNKLKGLPSSTPDSEKKQAALAKLEASVTKLLADGWRCGLQGVGKPLTISGAYVMAEEGRHQQEQIKGGIDKLEGSQSKAVEKFENYFPVLANMALIGVSGRVELPDIIRKLQEEGLKAASDAAQAAGKTALEVHEALDEDCSRVAAAFGFKGEDVEKVEGIEADQKKELEHAMTRPRSNAVVKSVTRPRSAAIGGRPA